jgi:hypothetical protein
VDWLLLVGQLTTGCRGQCVVSGRCSSLLQLKQFLCWPAGLLTGSKLLK